MRYATIAVFAAIAFSVIGPARAQTPTAPSSSAPSADALAAARDVIEASGAADNFKIALPIIMQNLKKAVVQNRPEVEKKYDELMPLLNQAAERRMGDLIDAIAKIYASNFSVGELHDIAAFYRSPTGQKYRQRLPALMQQSMAVGQQLGRSIAEDIQRISGPL